MNKIKFGMCSWCFPQYDFLEMMEDIKAMGFDGIELDFQLDYKNSPLLDETTCQTYIEKAKELGIEFSSISLNAFCACSPFKAQEKENIKFIMEKSIEIANRFNVNIMQVPAYGESYINNQQEYLQTIEYLKEFSSLALPHGIVISSENSLSIKENLEVIEKIALPNYKIYFDIQNPYIERGYDVPEMVEPFIKHICEVHSKDGKNESGDRLLGKGECSALQSLNELKKADYKGFVHLESNYMLIGENCPKKAKEAIAHDLALVKEIFA